MENDPFPSSEFDEWARTYDDSVTSDQFPFYGYKEVLHKTVEQAQPQPGMTFLDLGTGTGSLAALFVQQGCQVWGTDFSQPMLLLARRKVPQAHFSLQDLRRPWPSQLPQRFDRIVSAYVFHHFVIEEKVRIIDNLLREHLAPSGRLVIADIAFQDRAALEKLKRELGDQWEDEYYWIAAEALPAFQQKGLKVEYSQVSICAGVFSFEGIVK